MFGAGLILAFFKFVLVSLVFSKTSSDHRLVKSLLLLPCDWYASREMLKK